MSTRVKVFCLVGLCVLIGVVCRFALSQAPEDKKTAYVCQLFAAAVPHLEAVLGETLPVQPEFRVVSPDDYKKMPNWEPQAFLSWRFPSLQGEQRHTTGQLVHHAVAQATIARHVEGTTGIAVVLENLPVVAGWDAGLRAVNTPEFLRLELVHAVARLALEKKHQLLDRKHDPHSLEEFRIMQALHDGRAQWITWQVAKRLGTEAVFPLLARRWLHVPEAVPDTQIRAACQTTLQQKHWAYVQGKAFFEYLEAKELAGADSFVYNQPPRQVEWVEKPELYLQQASTEPDLKAVFIKLLQNAPVASWKPMQQPWTPAMLKQVAGMLKEEQRADKVAQGWKDGRSLIWTDAKNSGRYIAVSVVRFDAVAGARSYYGFAVDLQRKRDEMSGKSAANPLRVVDSRSEPWTGAGLDEGLRCDKALEISANGPTLPVTLLLGRAGASVVEFSWHGCKSDLNWAQQVTQSVMMKAQPLLEKAGQGGSGLVTRNKQAATASQLD
jgi:hypothetical protein